MLFTLIDVGGRECPNSFNSSRRIQDLHGLRKRVPSPASAADVVTSFKMAQGDVYIVIKGDRLSIEGRL